MKWVAAIFMILNVAVYLWASGWQVNGNEVENFSSLDVNKEGMLLLSEIGEQKQFSIKIGSELKETDLEKGVNEEETTGLDKSGGLTVVENSTDEQSEQVALESVQIDTSTDSAVDEVSRCYRIGPFKKIESWQLAQQWIDDQKIPFQPITSESRELRAVRVYLGPYNASTDAESMIRILKQKDLDHYRYKSENGESRISLGYFTQEELAAKFVGYLVGINIMARSQSEYRKLGPFNWMQIQQKDVDLDLLKNRQWDESSISVSSLNC